MCRAIEQMKKHALEEGISQAKGSFLPSGVFLNITPITIGTPIHGRRERAFEIGCAYDWFENKFKFTFSFIKLDFYVRGSWRDYK